MNGQWRCTTPTLEFFVVGGYDYSGSGNPASGRFSEVGPSGSIDPIGFRVALYL